MRLNFAVNRWVGITFFTDCVKFSGGLKGLVAELVKKKGIKSVEMSFDAFVKEAFYAEGQGR